MSKECNESLRKLRPINVLSESTLKQKESTLKLIVSIQIVSKIKNKKSDNKQDLCSNRVGRCGRKRENTPRSDKKII